RREANVGAQRLELHVLLARDELQRTPLAVEVVLRRDFLRDDQVVARLRFVRVGDGCGAALEVALRLRELLGDRRLLRAHEHQRVLRGQYVEIGLRRAHGQVLARLCEGRFGLPRLVIRLVTLQEVLRAVDRLRQRQRITKGGRVAREVRRDELVLRLLLDAHRRSVRREANSRQQERPALRDALAPGFERKPCSTVNRVITLRVAVYLQQILGGGWKRERRQCECPDSSKPGPSGRRFATRHRLLPRGYVFF